jgi:gamma-glutamyl-gamma-aminobutyraldehyde dehydrogenase
LRHGRRAWHPGRPARLHGAGQCGFPLLCTPLPGPPAFDTEAEAIALANATSYGLAASLWTTNLDTAFLLGRSIRAGTVSVNSYSEGDITTPFGGYKDSGFGGRDKGLEAFDQYTEKKTLWITLRG